MINQVILVGRIVTIEKEEKSIIISLAVPQNFKNADGEYDTDFINVRVFGNIADATQEYCQKGDIVGIKGRVQRIDNDKSMELIAEKVTFLSTRKEN